MSYASRHVTYATASVSLGEQEEPAKFDAIVATQEAPEEPRVTQAEQANIDRVCEASQLQPTEEPPT